MRYLAELMWNPDAILANRALEWHVVDARRIAVSKGAGGRRSEVCFLLDERGDISGVEAKDRPRLVGREIVPTRWFGRPQEWSLLEGRRIPTTVEVGWIIEGTEFIYWRGEITSWSAADRGQASKLLRQTVVEK